MIFNCPQALLDSTSLVERFVRYVRINTTSDAASESCPSTQGQVQLARLLRDELLELGLADAVVDDNGYLLATFQGNAPLRVGLLAHLDTSDQFCGENVKPVFHPDYDGRPIHLQGGVVIDPAQIPQLALCKGHTLITADGITLLGADDKAGIAIVMTALEVFRRHPELRIPTIRVGFTPDEEIGRGHVKFPLSRFGADMAFTLDGSAVGELNVETFEAWAMKITVRGVATHPGTAIGRMVNALRHLSRFVVALPGSLSPECTSGRDGFIHPTEIEGDSACAVCRLIIRDFDARRAEELCDRVESMAMKLKEDEPRLEICVERSFTYPNMGRFLLCRGDLIKLMTEAVTNAGATPSIVPIRGGTDGSNLSAKGLVCPNIFTGGMNFHGPTEWISTTNMASALCTTLNLMVSLADMNP